MSNLDKIEEVLNTIPEKNDNLHYDVYDEFDYVSFVINVMEVHKKQQQNLVYKLSKYENN